MAHKLEAITAFRPRIKRLPAADNERFLELTTARSTLSRGVVKNVQEAEVETLTGLLAEGRAVNTGTVTYIPSVDLEGNINVRARVDKRILRALNSEGGFRGRFTNAENVGKGQEELVAMWNEAHPDDPVE